MNDSNLSDTSNLDFEEHVQLFCELGLTPIQAKIYLTLFNSGELSARSMADSLNINRVDVYRALQRLQKLGMVEVSIGKPNKFVAAEPKIATSLLIDSLKRNLSDLSKKADFLNVTLESMGRTKKVHVETDAESSYFRLKNGEAVIGSITSIVKEAKHEIRKILTSRALGFHLLYGVLDIEQELGSRGVITKIITDAPSDISQRYGSFAELRYAGDLRETLRYIIVDDSAIIISLAANAAGPTDSVGLLTNNSTLIHALTRHFEETWNSTSTYAASKI
jgi:sugar-specific transcriptional regulator TrmB